MWGSACLRLSDRTFLFAQDSTVDGDERMDLMLAWYSASSRLGAVRVHRDYLSIVSIFTPTYQEQKQVQSEPE